MLDGSAGPPIRAPCGTTAGFEGGRAHRWISDDLAAGTEIELFVSSIPRRMGVLQRLPDGIIVVPADAEPAARILRNAVELHLAAFETGGARHDEAIVRRCAEICLIQFVRYARSRVAEEPLAPAGLAHDEHLRRAWTAYFLDPGRRWTLMALAEAAGLGRTAFAARFRTVVGRRRCRPCACCACSMLRPCCARARRR